MKYANIIVDLSADALDRLFSYAVPEGMDILPLLAAGVVVYFLTLPLATKAAVRRYEQVDL